MLDQVQRHKLLLADDSVTIQKVVNLTFADEGIDVIAVGDGNSALDMLREDSPDIVLADVNMPGMTGYEICAKIKEREPGKRIPVVLLVVSFEPFDEEEAERVGADGYLTKPFQSISQLVEKVAELLGTKGKSEVAPESELYSGNFEGENGIMTETGQTESGATSFPNPFEGFLRPEVSEKVSEPDVFEREIIDTESGSGKFEDIDDFEMSAAFAEEATETGFGPFSDNEDQIESVTDDFLKTQPLTDSDLQEIAVESDEPESHEEPGEFSEWTRAESDFGQPDTEAGEDEAIPPEDDGKEFEEMSDWAEERGEFVPEHGQIDETTGYESESNEHEEQIEKSFIFTSSERFEDDLSQFGLNQSPFESDLGNETPDDDAGFDGVQEDDSEAQAADPGTDLPLPEIASILDLDEMNLLELPSIDEEEVPEDIIQPDQAPPVFDGAGGSNGEGTGRTNEPGPERINGQNVVESVSEAVSADQGLSREMVEAITQRVIEVLSEKAVREIAWEVVPDMAELIIRKMAEEKLKN